MFALRAPCISPRLSPRRSPRLLIALSLLALLALSQSGCLPEGSGIKPRADAANDTQGTSGAEDAPDEDTQGTSGGEDTQGTSGGDDVPPEDTFTAEDTQTTQDTAEPPDTSNNVNECLTNNGGCDPLTVCIDTPTSRACGPCPSGYLGLGDTGCSDVNECANGTANCSPNADCTNTFGGFACDCKDGFQGDGVTCEVQVCGGLTCSGATPHLDAQRCQCVACLYSTHCGGRQCLSGVCSTCSCPAGTTCQGDECVPDGGCGGGCPAGNACVNNQCVPNNNCASCPAGTSCDPITESCYSPGGTCTTDADCRTTCGALGLCSCLGAADTTSCRPDEVCTELFPGFGAFCFSAGTP